MSKILSIEDPEFDKRALSQLRLYKPYRKLDDLRIPSIEINFFNHVEENNFPTLQRANNDQDFDHLHSEPEVSLINEENRELCIQQDEYQTLMSSGRVNVENDATSLLGNREIDLIHSWPSTWQSFSFVYLEGWLEMMKRVTHIKPFSINETEDPSLSPKQRKAYDIVREHTFGSKQGEQLLMIVIGTAGTGKSYLINSIRRLFSIQGCNDGLRVTAPTGIAASNIAGSTIYSVLSLLLKNLNGEHLLKLQTSMANVKFLIIDEYSFLSAAIIDTIDRRLREAFPHKSNIPFGGLSIMLCGDPAQLPPVRALPVYAHTGSTIHLAARFHLFETVVELDQLFRQKGSDAIQVRFRELLARIANCDATEEDWQWLQTRTSTCLSHSENAIFENSKFIVATNDARNLINRRRLSALSPVIKIDDCDENLEGFDNDDDVERYETNDLQLFAVGAEVMLTMNLWTELGLVNGACGTIVDILKPEGNRKARILMVDFPSYRGPAVLHSDPTVVPITQISTRKFKGIPLTLAWAITIHKSQGLSLDRATIDLGDKEFSSGLTFVALSRTKTFSGTRIVPFDYNRFLRISFGRYVNARRSEFNRLRDLAAKTSNI
jgi:hypothetical protein